MFYVTWESRKEMETCTHRHEYVYTGFHEEWTFMEECAIV